MRGAGWVAVDDDDDLGTWDGVDFTLGEATWTTTWAWTVASIMAARPPDTVPELSELYYVGGSALTILRDASAGEEACDATPETDDWGGEANDSP